MSKTEIDRMLNHTESGTIKHYISKEQTRQDVNQMHIFQEYRLLEVVKKLIDYFENHEHTTEQGDVIKYIPDSYFNKKINGRNVPVAHRKQILELGRLTKFSRDDEVRYQYLMLDALKGETRIIDGKMVRVEKQPEDYSDELKELITKRNELYDDNRVKLKLKDIDGEMQEIIYTPDKKAQKGRNKMNVKFEKNIDKQKNKVIDINKKVSNA